MIFRVSTKYQKMHGHRYKMYFMRGTSLYHCMSKIYPQCLEVTKICLNLQYVYLQAFLVSKRSES